MSPISNRFSVCSIEVLESRTLLSIASAGVIHSAAASLHSAQIVLPVAAARVTPFEDTQPGDFGTVAQGSVGPTRSFTVTNSNDAALTLGNLSVPAGFILTKALPSSLPPRGSDFFTVMLDTSTAGTFGGIASVTTGAPSSITLMFALTGTVTGSASTPAPTPTPTPTPTPASVPAAVTQVSTTLPAAVIGGRKMAKGYVTVTLMNNTTATFAGPVTVNVIASTDSAGLTGSSLPLGKLAKKLKLKSGKSMAVHVKVRVPAATVTGSFFIVATATAAGLSSTGHGVAFQVS